MSGPYDTEDDALDDCWRMRQRPDDDDERAGWNYQKLASASLVGSGGDLGIFDMVALRTVAHLDDATVQAIADLLLRRFEQGQQHDLDPEHALGGFCRTCGKQLSVAERWRGEQAGRNGQCPNCQP